MSVVASFTASPRTGTDSLSVQFTDTSTGTPTSWAWDFGDSSTSTSQNPIHAYSTPGVYTVVLTVISGLSTDTLTQADYIRIGFTDSLIKYSYVTVISEPVEILGIATEDNAPPANRTDLRIMYIVGVSNCLFINKGIRVYIPLNTTVPTGSGFERGQGPTILFD